MCASRYCLVDSRYKEASYFITLRIVRRNVSAEGCFRYGTSFKKTEYHLDTFILSVFPRTQDITLEIEVFLGSD